MDWKHLCPFYRQAPDARYGLVSLVDKAGASFRPRGARMLVRQDGASAGAISAGCLEEAIVERTQRTLKSGQPELWTIDTRPHYGCYGEITLLLEPREAADNSKLFGELQAALSSRQPRDVLTDWDLAHRVAGPRTRVLALSEPPAAAPDCLLERITPGIRVVVVGTWPDAVHLSALAQLSGLDVVSLDPKLAGQEAETLSRWAPPDAETAVVVMTHHLGRDVAYLAAALALPYPYVGVIGSRRRAEEIVNGLEQAAPDLLGELDRIHCPAGLDLGQTDVPGMALSILAEIHAVLHMRDAQPLRLRTQPIHG